MYEVEKKFQVADLGDIRDTLRRRFGNLEMRVVEQSDRYMAHPCRDFGRTDEAFRVRQLNDRYFVTYKGPKVGKTAKTRREIDLELGDDEQKAERFIEIFTELGFETVTTVTKRREEYEANWKNKSVRIALDDVESLGLFVEIETLVDRDRIPHGETVVNEVAKHLNLENAITTSYLEMIVSQERREV